MRDLFDTMMDPPVEDLLERCDSKFALVTLAADRARQINTYWAQLNQHSGGSARNIVPPQVTTGARKSLSIAFAEIAADQIIGVGGATGLEVPESLVAPVEEDPSPTPVA